MAGKSKESSKKTTTKKTDVALREEAVLAFWKEHAIFEKSLEKEAPEGEFVFYDGPPFATGLPHYGHILAGTIKDTIPRYQTMRGKRVRRTWGWDCHGLPLENIIEKKLGLETKKDIEELGIEQFNQAARDAVLEYADDWKVIVPRMGRWVDMEQDYKTMDASYTESVWWVFSELHRKGLVYEGFKTMHLCPRCGTTLSNFEVNLGYKDIKDIAVTVKLPLLDENEEKTDTSLLVWTTTPWTLPGNMAAAVHKDYDYVKVEVSPKIFVDDPKTDGSYDPQEIEFEKVILAKERLSQLDGEYTIFEEFKGKELVGTSYIPPFDYWQRQEFDGKENAWKIWHAPYVELGEEGTGAVHLAPAYGDEDMQLAQEHGIPIMHHVGEDGRFLSHVTDFAGMFVKPKDDEKAGVSHLDGDIAIVKALKEAGKLVKKENITHSYPLCWRCDAPLLNFATTSWFIEVTKIKDTLVKENKNIHWVPEHVGQARFGKWLENARDWAVSRQRYWGAPLPIWRNEKTKEYKVVGSLEELKEYTPKSGNTYFLMRHGEAEHNAKNITSSHIDTPHHLTEKGMEQMKEATAHIKRSGIDLIITSPYIRTKETAEYVAQVCGLTEEDIVYDERIGEIKMGELEGLPVEEYWAFWPETKERFSKRPDGGENLQDVRVRTGSFLYEIENTYQDKTILIITHDTPALMLYAVSCGCTQEEIITLKDQNEYFIDTAEVREIDFYPLPHNRDYELDYHRPFIDELTLVDTDGTKLVRVPDVFDCWFESGSMPYGQQHYPFANTDIFEPKKERGYPADFIAEGLDQTRGWFYSLIVLGTALFGQSPYRNVIANGLVLAEDGKKMSKSLQNYPDPMNVANTYGVDTMRFYLLSSSIIKGEDLNFSEKMLAELSRKNIGRLHNVLSFYNLYRDDAVVPNSNSEHVLDRWICSRLHEVLAEVTQGYDNYELDKATRPVTDFIDDLSVWYVRRSRDRFRDSTDDTTLALGTLRYVLGTCAHVIAPVMPFYAEHLYREVRTDRDPESVHLCDWPQVPRVDTDILTTMQHVRDIVSRALEVRAKENIKVRQPLNTLTVKDDISGLTRDLVVLIQDEVNVKEVRSDSSIPDAVVLDTTITPELKIEGDMREFIRQVQSLRKDMQLTPNDKVVLTLDTGEEGKRIIEAYKDDIVQTVNASDIIYDNKNDGKQVMVDTHSFVIKLTTT